jgi:hypothetical protein
MVPRALRLCRSIVPFVTRSCLVSALALGGCRSVETGPAPVPADHVAAGPLEGRTGAFLVVGDAASRVRVVLATLPGLLYRISTPAGSGLAPRVTGAAGRIRATFQPTDGDGPDEVRIVLNRAVRWDIRLPAGAGEQQLDLAGGRVTRVEMGASGLVELRLPDPVGTVPVSFTAGVGTVAMVAGPGTPMRIGLAGGSGPVVTPWAVRDAVAAGTVLQAPGWRTARDRYAIHARVELGRLILRRVSPAAR